MAAYRSAAIARPRSRPPGGRRSVLDQTNVGIRGRVAVLSLAAAVNMLSARLAETPNLAAPVRLEPMRRTAHAA